MKTPESTGPLAAFLVETAKGCVERAAALGYRGKRRDAFALDYWCGAAKMAEHLGRADIYRHMGNLGVMVLSVRGFAEIELIAAAPIKAAERLAFCGIDAPREPEAAPFGEPISAEIVTGKPKRTAENKPAGMPLEAWLGDTSSRHF